MINRHQFWNGLCFESFFVFHLGRLSQPLGRQGNTRRKVDFLQDQLTKRDFTVSCHAAASQNISEPELVTICIDVRRHASICIEMHDTQCHTKTQLMSATLHSDIVAAVKRFHLLGSQEKLGKMWFRSFILMFQGVHADLDQKDLCLVLPHLEVFGSNMCRNHQNAPSRNLDSLCWFVPSVLSVLHVFRP